MRISLAKQHFGLSYPHWQPTERQANKFFGDDENPSTLRGEKNFFLNPKP